MGNSFIRFISIFIFGFQVTYGQSGSNTSGAASWSNEAKYLGKNKEILRACERSMKDNTIKKTSLASACDVDPTQPVSGTLEASLKGWEKVMEQWGKQEGDELLKHRRELISGMNRKLMEKTLRNLLYHSQFMRPHENDPLKDRFGKENGFDFLNIPMEEKTTKDEIADYLIQEFCKNPPLRSGSPIFDAIDGNRDQFYFHGNMCYQQNKDGKFEKVGAKVLDYYRSMISRILDEKIKIPSQDKESKDELIEVTYLDYLKKVKGDNFHNISNLKAETLKVKDASLQKVISEINFDLDQVQNVNRDNVTLNLDNFVNDSRADKLIKSQANEKTAYENLAFYATDEATKSDKHKIQPHGEHASKKEFDYFINIANTVNRVCSAINRLSLDKMDIESGKVLNSTDIKVSSTDKTQLPNKPELPEIALPNANSTKEKDGDKKDVVRAHFQNKFDHLSNELKKLDKEVEEERNKLKAFEAELSQASENNQNILKTRVSDQLKRVNQKESAYAKRYAEVSAFQEEYLKSPGNPIENKIKEYKDIYKGLMKDMLANSHSKFFSIPDFRDNFGFVKISECDKGKMPSKLPRFVTNEDNVKGLKGSFPRLRDPGKYNRWRETLGKMVLEDLGDAAIRNLSWSLEEPFIDLNGNETYFSHSVDGGENLKDKQLRDSESELVRLFIGGPDLYLETIDDKSLAKLNYSNPLNRLPVIERQKLINDWKKENIDNKKDGRSIVPRSALQSRAQNLLKDKYSENLNPYHFQSTDKNILGQTGSDWVNFHYGKALCSTLLSDQKLEKHRKYQEYFLIGGSVLFGGVSLLATKLALNGVELAGVLAGDFAFATGDAVHMKQMLEESNIDDWQSRISRNLNRNDDLKVEDMNIFESSDINPNVTPIAFGFTLATFGLYRFDFVEVKDALKNYRRAQNSINQTKESVRNMVAQATNRTNHENGVEALTKKNVPKPKFTNGEDVGGVEVPTTPDTEGMNYVNAIAENIELSPADDPTSLGKVLGFFGNSPGSEAAKKGKKAYDKFVVGIESHKFRTEYLNKTGSKFWPEALSYEDFLFLQLLKHSPKKSAKRIGDKVYGFLQTGNEALIAQGIRILDELQDTDILDQGQDNPQIALGFILDENEAAEVKIAQDAKENAKARAKQEGKPDNWEDYKEEEKLKLEQSRDPYRIVVTESESGDVSLATANGEVPPKRKKTKDKDYKPLTDEEYKANAPAYVRKNFSKLRPEPQSLEIIYEDIASEAKHIMDHKHKGLDPTSTEYADKFDEELELLLDERTKELTPYFKKQAQRELNEVVMSAEFKVIDDPRLKKMKACSQPYTTDLGYSFRTIANFRAREKKLIAHTETSCPYTPNANYSGDQASRYPPKDICGD